MSEHRNVVCLFNIILYSDGKSVCEGVGATDERINVTSMKIIKHKRMPEA